MKHILPIAMAAVYIMTAACADPNESNMQYIGQMKDSIFKAYPTVASITIEIKDKRALDITIGDRHLFKADASKQQQEATEMGIMAVHLFPKNTDIDKGTLVISDDEKSTVVDRTAAKIIPINIDSLRKSNK